MKVKKSSRCCGCCDFNISVYKLTDHVSIRGTYGYCVYPFSLNYEPDFKKIQELEFKGVKVQEEFCCDYWQMYYTKHNNNLD